MIHPKDWMRQLLCRIGWDAACDNNARELEDQRARMQTLTWQFRTLIRQATEDR